MAEWEKDKKWSDRFLPEIKSILGQALLTEPPVQEDQERNTDLICLKMESVRIAARIRKYEYLCKYPNEFTIRSKRPSGIKTELAKIIEGWGDFLFYGFSDQKEEKLLKWSLIDLKVFRLEFMRYMATNNGRLPGIKQLNHDKSSIFIGFNIDLFSETLLFAKSN